MQTTLTATRTDDQTTQSSFGNELVNAIRDGRLIQVRFDELTPEEKRQAYNALFNPCNW